MYEWMTPDKLIDFVQGFYGLRNVERSRELAREFDLPMNRKIKIFSKGMKQKLYLMQALIHDPELLILDEPTTGLDPIVRNEVCPLRSGKGLRHGRNLAGRQTSYEQEAF